MWVYPPRFTAKKKEEENKEIEKKTKKGVERLIY